MSYWKRQTDEENKQAIAEIIGDNDSYGNPLLCFKRTANGPVITKPSHIFMLVGESYMHQLFEPAYACLNLVSGGNTLFHDPHTATLPNFLSAGIISRPSIVSLMTGIFDAGLELNEREAWWHSTVPTALPMQQTLGVSFDVLVWRQSDSWQFQSVCASLWIRPGYECYRILWCRCAKNMGRCL